MIKKNNDRSITLNLNNNYFKKEVGIFFDCELFFECLIDEYINNQLCLVDYSTGLIYKLPFNNREEFFYELLINGDVILFPYENN